MLTNASCRKCTFFDHHPKATAVGRDDGLCRYNPPVTQPGPTEHGLWPVVSVRDWCGHFAAAVSSRLPAAE